LGLNLLVWGLAGVAVLPLAWMVGMAFGGLPGGKWTLENFRILMADEPMGRWLVNSLFVSCSYAVLVVMLSALGGYALAKFRFAGKGLAQVVLVGALLLPPQVLLPGSYELMVRIGWIDSFAALIVPGGVSVFGMLLFRQAMMAVPDELLSAGRMDGCGEFRLWWGVAMPMVGPMAGAFTLMSFISAWNAFLWPQIILQDQGKYTLPIGLANLSALPGYQANQGLLMAATLVGVLPAATLFLILQRDFVAGLSGGAVKG
jgi:ABC-type glycerol-3-phosphate transport system permease component